MLYNEISSQNKIISQTAAGFKCPVCHGKG
jgi:hypothetical protein